MKKRKTKLTRIYDEQSNIINKLAKDQSTVGAVVLETIINEWLANNPQSI